MRTKEEYRAYFKQCQKIIKFKPILLELKIPETNFSKFMQGLNSVISLERLELINKKLEEIGKNIMEGVYGRN